MWKLKTLISFFKRDSTQLISTIWILQDQYNKFNSGKKVWQSVETCVETSDYSRRRKTANCSM